MNTHKPELCLAISKNWQAPEQSIRLLADVGWDGFFVIWAPGDDLRHLARIASDSGMRFQSVHTPWNKAAWLWGENEAEAEAATSELVKCIEESAAAGVPLVVAHAWIGFVPTAATDSGIERFARVLSAARSAGIRVALENTEGENHLDALMSAYRDAPELGFCWDTGHELCYNRSRDMLGSYGDRLFATHLNDNLGISDESGPTTWLDDLHLLPFDGKADWPGIAARLRKSGFDGPLTFELNRTSRPGRHENDAYAALPLRDYVAEALNRARRFAALFEEAPSASH